MIAGFTLVGFGGGNCQLAAFALPELLPSNAYRKALEGPFADFPKTNGDPWVS